MYHDVGRYSRPDWVATDEPLFVGLNLRMPELSSAILRPQLARLERQMARRHRRRRILVEALRRQPGLHISPHHDPDTAVGLTVCFDTPDAAKAFAERPGVNRLLDTGRHVYTNWAIDLDEAHLPPGNRPVQVGVRHASLRASLVPADARRARALRAACRSTPTCPFRCSR